MKILVLSPGIPSALNSGLGIAANAINRELAALVDLAIVQPDNVPVNEVVEEHTIEVPVETSVFSSENIARQEIELTVSARLDPYHYDVSGTTVESKTENFKKVTEEIGRYTRQVITKTKKVNFDLIYAHDWVTFQTAVAIKDKTGVPFVAHVHSLDYDRGAKRYRSFVYDIEKDALTKADAIITVSSYTRNVLIKQYDVDQKKISIVHNAVSPFKVPVVKKLLPEKIILFVGRLSVQKGPEIFIEIARQLASKRDDVRFVVVGDGDLYIQLVEQSAKAMDVKFHFTGHCNFNEVCEFYSMADVYCMPSVSEPFGLSAIEAAMAGVPVVLSRDAGAAEILKGAFLADPEQPRTFVDQLDAILDDPERAKKSVSENTKCIKGLTWENTATQIAAIFNECQKK